MARPWSRKRSGGDAEPAAAPTDDGAPVDLTGEEHAWWAQREVHEVWKPKPGRRTPDAQAEEDKRDILAEHFGDDWRTSFGFTPPAQDGVAAALEEERRKEQQLIDDGDPYKVLGVASTASWDEIVAAHRDMARIHHPDRLFGQSEEEKAEGEERIRVINTAYQELRVRRGK